MEGSKYHFLLLLVLRRGYCAAATNDFFIPRLRSGLGLLLQPHKSREERQQRRKNGTLSSKNGAA
jgi:hypothetical protein